MTNHRVDESVDIMEYLEKPEVKEGDTIEVISNNQLGYRKYKVVLDKDGKKDTETIADWGMDLYEEDNGVETEGESDEDEPSNKRARTGGRRKTRKGRKSRKSRGRKSSRKGGKSRKGRKSRRSRKY